MPKLAKKNAPPDPEQAALTEVILNSVSDGVFSVDADWHITSFNRAAEQIIGIAREDAMGQPCHQVFRSNICERDCALRQTIATGEVITCKTIYIVRPDGQRRPISISTGVLHDATGQVIGGVETFRDLGLQDPDPIQSDSFYGMLSRDTTMRALFKQIPELARSDSTILILGESGTGKELLAKAIHALSPRANKALVTVNCGALPDNLLESELFGYKRGAFTDAREDREGKLAAAEGGTLFLDEIGDVSPALQSRLLRVLQEREYQRLGDNKTRQADLRFIAATNKDLQQEIAAGRFRADLFYRLAVVDVHLPPLHERLGDVALLAEHFLARLRETRHKEVLGFSHAALATLLRYEFPGHVRELHNIVEHAFVLCQHEQIQTQDLPQRVLHAQDRLAGTGTEQARQKKSAGHQSESTAGYAKTHIEHFAHEAPRIAQIHQASKPSESLAENEERLIRQALQDNAGRRNKSAKQLGISSTTLWRKMKKYGLL